MVSTITANMDTIAKTSGGSNSNWKEICTLINGKPDEYEL